MIYFDELSVAEKMEKRQSFTNGYSVMELIIYAKYLKYKKVIESGAAYSEVSATQLESYDKEVENALRLFCEGCCNGFNYTVSYKDIDHAVNVSNKYLLKLPSPIPITKKEWETIKSVKNEKYQRMLFVMLVDAKYYRMFNTSIEKRDKILSDSIFYIRIQRNEIQKTAKIKYDTSSEKTFFLGCIAKQGLFGITENRLRTWYLTFVDISNECIIDYITDYDHLDLHYEKLNGSKIGKCEKCGKLFKQNKYKDAKYCYRHRGKEKMITKICTCIDCGNEFTVGSKSRKKCRCDECQRKKHLSDMREWKRNHK